MRQSSPKRADILPKLVGKSNETTVMLNGIETLALIDSGSQITTLSEDFYNNMTPRPTLYSIEDLGIKVEAAGGHILSYLGAIACEIEVPFLGKQSIKIGALVLPTTDYSLNVPVIVGTNAIAPCRDRCESNTEGIPNQWKNAFIALQDTHVGVVKSTDTTIQVQPNETVTISGFVRKKRNVESVVTEQTQGASSKIGVCPRVVSLDKAEKCQRVPVRIYNMSAKVMTIQPKSDLCELHEVKVLRNIDPVDTDKERITANQYHIRTQEESTKDELPSGIKLEGSTLTSEETDELQKFLIKWKDIFSTGITDLGNCDLYKHEIHLTDETPFKEPHRRIPPALFDEIKEHLKEMLEAGAIRPSSSPFSSNVVVVRKKDGSIRFCVDFRKLNNKTVKDAYAIPRIEDTLHLLAGSRYFTKLDLRSGYWQVELREKDKQKTAFQVGTMGFYEFNRMPFGLCNAPATFQRLMERCMGEMNLRDCLIYLDDVIIFSTTFEEHLERLEAVFERLKDHNLKLKASKCEFMKSRVTYLGHVVSENGIETDPDKTEAVRTWPIPRTVKDVRAYLGFTGYYRRFIQNYARIARPLNDLLIGHSTSKKGKKKNAREKKTPFIWTEKQQNAFDTLKERLVNPPVLAYADYRLPFKLHTDASTTGLGAVLYQQQDGQDRVVAYASRSLKTSEKNYPAHKLEFLALKWAITEKFHDYLYGATFDVVTDNNPLTYVFTTAKLDATGQRWLAELSNYNCSISYRSGKQNSDADGLSRRKDLTETTIFPEVLKVICHAMTTEQVPLSELLTNPEEDTASETDVDQDVSSEVLQGTALTTQDWHKAQSKDNNIRLVIDGLLEGQRPNKLQDKRYLLAWDSYKLKDGILYKRATLNEEDVEQLVLPSSLIDTVFKAYHDDLGHQGRDRTTSLIRRRFFWPGMNKDIKSKIQMCGRCIRRKTAPTKATELVNITSTAPMELVCIDFLSLEKSKGGQENILVITDHYSRYAQAIPTRNQKASTTAKALYENFFLHYGFPAVLHSDKGANFESNVIRKLCEIAGVKKSRTTPYHPMGNGMVERYNKTLLNMLGTLSEDQKTDWKSYVSTLTHAYNAAEHESTGYAPFFLMFGRHPRLAIDAFLGLNQDQDIPRSHMDYVDKLRHRLDYAYNKASEEAKRAAEKQKKYYDKRVRYIKLEPGDRVLIRNVGLRGKQKLADIWDKHPYLVKSQPVQGIPVYEVQQENSRAKSKLLHRNMLLPFNGLPVPTVPKPPKATQRPVIPSEDSYQADSSSSSTENFSTPVEQRVGRYVIPQRRRQTPKSTSEQSYGGTSKQTSGSGVKTDHVAFHASPDPGYSLQTSSSISSRSSSPDQRPRRGSRARGPPLWMRTGDWQIQHQPYIIDVDPFQISEK